MLRFDCNGLYSLWSPALYGAGADYQDDGSLIQKRVDFIVEEPAVKINVLLQAYISQLKLEGFVPAADSCTCQGRSGYVQDG